MNVRFHHHRTLHRLRLLALAGAAASSLLTTACVPLVVAGGAAGGALLADRRSTSTQVADEGIELRAQDAVRSLLGSGAGHVSVTSYYRKVLLSGEVPTAELRERIGAAVAAMPDQLGVINELAVQPDSSTGQRAADTATTARVKAKLLEANEVPASSIKVVTERGTTYLMGRLSQREADLATEVTRSTQGVERVVRAIEVVSPAEARHPLDGVLGGSNAGPRTPAPVRTADGVPTTVPAEQLPAGSNAVEATGVVTTPVLQPTVVNTAPQPIQVQTLPPLK